MNTTTGIEMAAQEATEADLALLTLNQWVSPAFPLGSFAYSQGLESAICNGQVATAEDLLPWLDYVLQFGAGRSDAILVHAALRGDDAHQLSASARALAPAKERVVEMEELGAAFVRTVNALTGRSEPVRPFPVAFGVAARDLDLPATRIVAFYLQGLITNLLSCACRAMPLGQTQMQRVLRTLSPSILQCAQDSCDTQVDRISTGAFFADLCSMQHEVLTVRVFKT